MKVLVYGASGRMGHEIIKIVSNEDPWSKVFAVPAIDISKKNVRSVKTLTELKSSVDVVIDFSTLKGFAQILKWCVKNSTPLVSGTTGFARHEKQLLKEAAKKIPIFWAPNMSIGVAALKKALNSFSSLKDFDFEIRDVHHKHKVDNPSGTAVMLHKELSRQVGKKVKKPHGIRAGGVFGIHEVIAFGEEEIISFKHEALNRGVFAKGAVSAAKWIADKQPGLFSMDDLI